MCLKHCEENQREAEEEGEAQEKANHNMCNAPDWSIIAIEMYNI